ncbi:MAG TPA: HAD-IIIC family phosphatase [Chryseolinea sp.]|nr:HAD-IIIC family phosphatase [Chryseolinea sp.]
MKTFAELKKNLKVLPSNLKSIRVAILGDTATQLLTIAIKGTAIESGYTFDVFEADFGQIENQIYDSTSNLFEFKPEVIIIFHSTHRFLLKYNKLLPTEHSTIAEKQLNLIKDLVEAIDKRLQSTILYFNYPEIDDAVYGNYSNKVKSSFLFQTRKLNYELMEFSQSRHNLFLVDVASLQNLRGRLTAFQPSLYVNAEMIFALDILPDVAARAVDIIVSLRGNVKKCLILDLDNTLWGGVIGDDGMENIQIGGLGIGKAFSELQYWIRKLKDRGIILAVCSKNSEEIAKEPFEKHPDMVLRLNDIAVFVANWEDKVSNIKHIQSILNIGFDSMVFLDDNPFERNFVRANISDIAVPELPEDPSEYLEYLYSQNLFETTSVSEADAERTKQYQVEAHRSKAQKAFSNEDDFLRDLEMVSVVERFNKFTTPRVAQLSQRSNQFNLRTVRYSEADIESLVRKEDYDTLSFTLADRFGDNGLVCAVVMRKQPESNTLFVESWFMSCRVLKRGMERFVLNTIIQLAKDSGYMGIVGEYIPSAKNGMVKDHYSKLGFCQKEQYWHLNLSQYEIKPVYIKTVEGKQ